MGIYQTCWAFSFTTELHHTTPKYHHSCQYLRKSKHLSVLGIKNHQWGKAPFYHRESAAWRPCLLHFDKKLCLWRMNLTSSHVLLNGYLENVFATSMPEAKRWCSQLRRKPTEVRPITLAIATCQMEQIEFVFLRWLVGALNSVLVALLIKAVKANLFSCEPRRLKSASGWYYTYINSCQSSPKMYLSSSSSVHMSIPGRNNDSVLKAKHPLSVDFVITR